ncbi:MAG: hypothetical protein KBT39_00875 [Bacteroidales bacterium]|nr:hypothetical protein [Bacteroidales bacterium]
MMVGEAAIDLRYLESSVDEKVKYLRENLHPTTVTYLEEHGFMMNQPFPYNEEDLKDDWLNETDEQNPIVPEDVIKSDREAWLGVR